ncbi:hypothetical protein NEOLI_005269 [Neolecta irregularis DAH-3]|uniref:Uncharacterized protein n=1 Tax=Neolecta irregularis (strain DAH-3) TaxID=1198029 RepID=A0A1U7LG76_NEOID|nr:hypothetical protein NEOLI_005269 [Neolecta irregularis DAH-3]|eukprot:OLL21628.1 hypothetical protein NEOLI_005269 [Neolecta irregularis DAH-3]
MPLIGILSPMKISVILAALSFVISAAHEIYQFFEESTDGRTTTRLGLLENKNIPGRYWLQANAQTHDVFYFDESGIVKWGPGEDRGKRLFAHVSGQSSNLGLYFALAQEPDQNSSDFAEFEGPIGKYYLNYGSQAVFKTCNGGIIYITSSQTRCLSLKIKVVFIDTRN